MPSEATDRTAAEAGGDAGIAAAWSQATAARLRTRHWRERPRFFTRPRWWFVAAVIVLHGAFLLVARQALRGAAVEVVVTADQPLQVRFVPIAITAAPPPPAPPRPEDRRVAATARPTASAAPVPPPAASVAPPPPAPQIYTRDGLIRLPPPTNRTAQRGFVPDVLQGDAKIMHPADPVPYRATPFDPYFPSLDESAGQALVRRTVDTIVKTKEIDLPRGIHLQCHTVFGIPTPDCRVPPPSPSTKIGDERLNMAPATAAGSGVNTPAKPDLATCIAIYNAGKPLPWGCPTDTPARAVDAELKAQAAKGKQEQH